MQQTLFTIVSDADFVAINTTDGATGTRKIQNAVSLGGNTYYITTNLSRPATSTYAMMLMPNGTFIASQSRLPALTPVLTFLGWAIPI